MYSCGAGFHVSIVQNSKFAGLPRGIMGGSWMMGGIKKYAVVSCGVVCTFNWCASSARQVHFRGWKLDSAKPGTMITITLGTLLELTACICST